MAILNVKKACEEVIVEYSKITNKLTLGLRSSRTR